jgi:membrane protease YdiL (CAAX protease family)
VPFIEELIFRVILFESIKVNEEFHFILLNSFQTLIFIMIHFIVNKGYYGILVINLAYINGQIYFTEKNFLKMYGLHSIYNFIALIFTIQW